MKRKVFTALIVLLCLCSLTVLTSCDVILDLIFGSTNPPEQQHVHSMETKTYSGSVCSGQGEVTYYKCTSCGKCYLDEAGTDEIDENNLSSGHAYVLRYNDTEHYRLCALCSAEQEGTRAAHSSDRYRYTSTEHYKLCDVCNAVFDSGEHDANLSCDVCGRSADYQAMCKGRYGYAQLQNEFKNYVNMQKLYDKIDNAVQAAHDDKDCNFNLTEIADGDKDYALSVKDCLGYQLTSDEASIVVATYRNDNPLYYWIGSRIGLSSPPNVEYVSTINICVDSEYRLGADRVAENANIYAEIDSYLSYVGAETDPYNIALGLHDKIIDNINYAYKADGITPENSAWAHDIAGVFCHKAAVCEGYAKAFQLLLNACNVNNAYVTGTGNGEGHAWNVIQLANDNWYWCDITWDDQPGRVRGVMYDYFCVSGNEFKNHTVSVVKSGLDYQCDLPAVATAPYQTDGLELNETFTKDGITYKMVGYNRLAVDKCLYADEDGVVTIPATVTEGGVTYKVAQINEEAFATYTRKNGVIVSIVHPQVTKIVIPETVDLIYSQSLSDCGSLSKVEFANLNGWTRYLLKDQDSSGEKMSADKLSNEVTACSALKEYQRELLAKYYYYVWINTAE